ncbi:hypothetical protein GQ457_03G034180 [Hibiscus cannabinus]
MASLHTSNVVMFLVFLVFPLLFCVEARRLVESDQTEQPLLFQYHNGPLLSGKISVNLIWYGNFKPSQRAIVSDFVYSVASPKPTIAQPSVATWWKATQKYYQLSKKPSSLALSLGSQILDDNYSLGKSLTNQQIVLIKVPEPSSGPAKTSDFDPGGYTSLSLHGGGTSRRQRERYPESDPIPYTEVKTSRKGALKNAINVVLTSADVTVNGFCSNRCGTHGSASGSSGNGHSKLAYIWVGNSETQCPGQCAWPFHQPIYGPQNPALVAPNNDVGLDGMVINLAGLLAGTVTNPFGNGYYQGPKEAPLEAASACPGIYGKGAYPGYAGDLLVDATTGASYNANGVNGRKYLLPALFDPSTSTCATLA